MMFSLGGGVVLYSPTNGDVVLNECTIGRANSQTLSISSPPIHVDEGNLEIGIIEENSPINILSPTTTTSQHHPAVNSISTKAIDNTTLGVIHYENLLESSGTNGGKQFCSP